MDINVLWIDDQPNNAFIDKAYNEGINIEVRETVDAGIDELVNSSANYDAIILDANCKSHNDGSEEDISALSYALRMITENQIVIPWFVYSGGGFSGEESIDIIVKSYERNYDSVYWYKKPSEMNKLFSQIKSIAPNFSDYKIKSKYSDIFSWYPNQKELLEILAFMEQEITNDPDIFNKMRKELDWVMGFLYESGLLLEPYKGSNLGDCSTFLGKKELISLVPLHVQRSFHSTTTICNEGSHRLVIDQLVKDGKAPYLVYSTTYEFLNILYWLKDVPKIPNLKGLVAELLKAETTKPENQPVVEEYDGKDFEIEQDERGNFHCGRCRLSYKAAQNLVGKTVTLINVKENDAKSKDNYPFFANFQLKK